MSKQDIPMGCFNMPFTFSGFGIFARWRREGSLHDSRSGESGYGWFALALWVQFLLFLHLCLPFFQELARTELYQGMRGFLMAAVFVLVGGFVSASRRRTTIFSILTWGLVLLCLVCALVGNDLFPPWKKAFANASIFGLGFLSFLDEVDLLSAFILPLLHCWGASVPWIFSISKFQGCMGLSQI